MCGIIFAKSLRNLPVNRHVIEQFQDQKSRGTEGFGLAMQDAEGKIIVNRATDQMTFLLDLQPTLNPSSMILAHHRQPTSTPNLTWQTHPILVSHELLDHDFLISHNGVIHNAETRRFAHKNLFATLIEDYLAQIKQWKDTPTRINELIKFKYVPIECFNEENEFQFEEAVKREAEIWDNQAIRNFHYSTEMDDHKFNDSEALAVELALYLEHKLDKIETHGSAAYVGLILNKETRIAEKLFFGRNLSSPLRFARDNQHISVSSQGAGEEVTADKLFMIDLLNAPYKLTSFDLVIEPYIYTPSYNSTSKLPIITVNQKDLPVSTSHLESPPDQTIPPLDDTEEDPVELQDEKLEELLFNAEQDIENQISDFLELIASSSDLTTIHTLVETLAESMKAWQRKVEDRKYELFTEREFSHSY